MSRPNGVDCSRQFEGLMAQFERKAVSCDEFAILKNQSHVELGQTKKQTNKIILIWNQEHKVKPPNVRGKNTFKFEHKTHASSSTGITGGLFQYCTCFSNNYLHLKGKGTGQ